MSKAPDIVAGLAVTSLGERGHAWRVTHGVDGLALHWGYLRQKRFAEQARADFLATGIDFTLSRAQLQSHLAVVRSVHVLWSARARQDRIDLVTGEHYSWSTHYGQVIPSREHAARLAEALASYMWS